MQIDVQFAPETGPQLRSLTPAQRQDVGRLATAIKQNPKAFRPSYERELPNGETQLVYIVFGLLCKVRFTYKGWLRKTLVVWIESVEPTDLPSLTEYEEGEEERRSRPPVRGRRSKAGDEDR